MRAYRVAMGAVKTSDSTATPSVSAEQRKREEELETLCRMRLKENRSLRSEIERVYQRYSDVAFRGSNDA